MSDMFKKFRDRTVKDCKSHKEVELMKMRNAFDKYLGQSPTSLEIPITNPECFPALEEKPYYPMGVCHLEDVVVNDIVYNDKKALDEKYIKLRHDSKVDIGCYFFMDNCWWLIQFKDHKEIDSYKRFTARRCNQILKYKINEDIIELPVSIENLTMYSDGLADVKYNTSMDAKRHIWYGSNELSRKICVGTRIMLKNSTVFEATHINDFEYNGNETGCDGLIKTLVSQVEMIDRDDTENNIAYNENKFATNIGDNKIEGANYITLGSTKTYKISNNFEGEWVLEENPYLELIQQDNSSCKVKAKFDIKGVGELVNLKYVVEGEKVSEINILVRGVGNV